ncbi:MAG: phosphate signaling complex protein PhoU [Verrucomicrobia bacterium]|nr:phosphate signaling complex protein PhoU [Verrucomicrobiota bacterium]
MKEHFTQEISQLKRHLARQATEAEAALGKALQAIATFDAALAAQVAENDYAIDCEEIRIEEDCLKILALYQPVASDLRTIVTVLKINSEIERVADMAVNIAERTKSVAESGVPAEKRIDFTEMANVATAMLKDALDAFAYRDPAAARAVIRRDDEVDALHAANIKQIQADIANDPARAAYYLSCMTISKNLERIGDVATNICEDVIYLECGTIVRHGNAG